MQIQINSHPCPSKRTPGTRFQCLQNISRKIGKGDNLSEDTPVTTYKSKRLLFTPWPLPLRRIYLNIAGRHNIPQQFNHYMTSTEDALSCRRSCSKSNFCTFCLIVCLLMLRFESNYWQMLFASLPYRGHCILFLEHHPLHMHLWQMAIGHAPGDPTLKSLRYLSIIYYIGHLSLKWDPQELDIDLLWGYRVGNDQPGHPLIWLTMNSRLGHELVLIGHRSIMRRCSSTWTWLILSMAQVVRNW